MGTQSNSTVTPWAFVDENVRSISAVRSAREASRHRITNCFQADPLAIGAVRRVHPRVKSHFRWKICDGMRLLVALSFVP